MVLQIKLLKPKTSSEKNNQRKQHSSGSGKEEEPVPLELVVPHKGKELPRTPPSRPGSYTDPDENRLDFLAPRPARLSPSIPIQPPRTYSKQTTIGKNITAQLTAHLLTHF